MNFIITILLVVSLSVLSFCLNAQEEVRILMGNASGAAQNVNVIIADPGTAPGGGAHYNKLQRAIENTSDGTRINIRGLDFGNGRYGLFAQISIEYTLNQDVMEDAGFDLSLDNSAYVFASVPVSSTSGINGNSSSSFNVNITGNHTLCILWKKHGASIKTVTLVPQKPLARVKAARSSSPLQIKFTSAELGDIEGVHNVKMVWKNQSANVYAVYLDKGVDAGVDSPAADNILSVSVHQNFLEILSVQQMKKVQVFTSTGSIIANIEQQSFSFQAELLRGFYITRVTMDDGSIIINKIIIK